MKKNKITVIIIVGIIWSSCAVFNKNRNPEKNITGNNNISASGAIPALPTDTSKKPQAATPKLYKDVITSKAVTDSGLFTVHRIEDKVFFEIPISIFERDILVVNRIVKGAANNRPFDGLLGYSGEKIGNSLIRVSKGPRNKLFIKSISCLERSTDSSENGLYHALYNSNLQPIVAAFDVKAYTADSSSVVIDVTDFINGDNSLFYFDPVVKKNYKLGAIAPDKSYLSKISSYPINIEIQTVKTYVQGEQTATFELNSSIVLLPAKPMKPRYADDRVGYFYNSYIDFDAPQGAKNTFFITRWRLEPKEKDKDKYYRGELVEPKKPIVYYIDPATPKKWVPYLIQGVNDWQKAFEKAGFKNAIYALEAPVNDPEWSLYDARHNAIIYMPSAVPNAMGPHVNDPRSGEIIESHIYWYHNVIQLLRNWYFVQASPNDARARKMEFEDELMGELIRFVSSHEVGHTLGLAHNFGSSSTVSVEKLRNKEWVEENGHTPSIMDYARFNYVAQPEDKIGEKGIFPRIGMYDKWAIEWGYKILPEHLSVKEEYAYMNKWIISMLEKDKRYYFGRQTPGQTIDPRNQSEDLGDNAMKAGYYGIKNLERVMNKLKEWTREENEDYTSLGLMKKEVVNQYYRYILHVANNIGLYKWTNRAVEEKGSIVEFVPREKQKEAVAFLQEQLFTTPTWLINSDIFPYIGGYGYNQPIIIQQPIINMLLSYDTYSRMFYFETEQPDMAYRFDELLTDLANGIWSELNTGANIEVCRRNLQRLYAERLKEIANPAASNNPRLAGLDYVFYRSDMNPIVNKHLQSIISKINSALPRYKNGISRQHLMAIKKRLLQTNDNSPQITNGKGKTESSFNIYQKTDIDLLPKVECCPATMEWYKGIKNCWNIEQLLN